MEEIRVLRGSVHNENQRTDKGALGTPLEEVYKKLRYI